MDLSYEARWDNLRDEIVRARTILADNIAPGTDRETITASLRNKLVAFDYVLRYMDDLDRAGSAPRVTIQPDRTPDQQAAACQTCDDDPTWAPNRYCASRACVCGHTDCPAHPNTPPRPTPNLTVAKPASPNSWTARDEPTWIDNL